MSSNKFLLSYIIGVALGDGNLSKYRGRVTRLRITCDKKYPILLNRIKKGVERVLPNNKVQIINRKGCFDISSYSNYWPKILGWEPQAGSKYKQKVKVPKWVEKIKNTHGCVLKDCSKQTEAFT